MFAERIKELDGEPTTEQPGKAEKRQQVKDVFPFNAKLEDDTIDAYNQFVLVCRENGDSTSVKIFEAIIDEEQVHFNYFDSVSTHIDQLGDTYLALELPVHPQPPASGRRGSWRDSALHRQQGPYRREGADNRAG